MQVFPSQIFSVIQYPMLSMAESNDVNESMGRQNMNTPIATTFSRTKIIHQPSSDTSFKLVKVPTMNTTLQSVPFSITEEENNEGVSPLYGSTRVPEILRPVSNTTTINTDDEYDYKYDTHAASLRVKQTSFLSKTNLLTSHASVQHLHHQMQSSTSPIGSTPHPTQTVPVHGHMHADRSQTKEYTTSDTSTMVNDPGWLNRLNISYKVENNSTHNNVNINIHHNHKGIRSRDDDTDTMTDNDHDDEHDDDVLGGLNESKKRNLNANGNANGNGMNSINTIANKRKKSESGRLKNINKSENKINNNSNSNLNSTLNSIGGIGMLGFVPLENRIADLGSKFLKKKELGSGATSRVILAQEISSQGYFALKQMLIKQPGNLEQFRCEYKILSQLKHENIASLYNCYMDNYNYCIAVEYCSGGMLIDYIKQMNTFNEGEACKYIKSILNAICFMHRKNIIHRDLKPENIVFNTPPKSSNKTEKNNNNNDNTENEKKTESKNNDTTDQLKHEQQKQHQSSTSEAKLMIIDFGLAIRMCIFLFVCFVSFLFFCFFVFLFFNSWLLIQSKTEKI